MPRLTCSFRLGCKKLLRGGAQQQLFDVGRDYFLDIARLPRGDPSPRRRRARTSQSRIGAYALRQYDGGPLKTLAFCARSEFSAATKSNLCCRMKPWRPSVLRHPQLGAEVRWARGVGCALSVARGREPADVGSGNFALECQSAFTSRLSPLTTRSPALSPEMRRA